MLVMLRTVWAWVLLSLAAFGVAGQAAGEEPAAAGLTWVRPGPGARLPQWGVRNGLQWGLPPAQEPRDGPRGLIRLRYPTLADGQYDLINFIAIEPVVGGRKGFSELERSQLDGVAGKRLWALPPEAPPGAAPAQLPPGQISRQVNGAERLTVRIGVERFENGAHVSLTLTQSSGAPDELELTIDALPDSAPLEYCILTATMGNKARARQLWLRGEVVSSLKLYPDYREPNFAPHRFFVLDRLCRTAGGEVLAAITTDEANPGVVESFRNRPYWRYAGQPVTQYWKKPAGAWRADLHVAVNGRFTYWQTRQPIPGGVAFENFEMRERFYPGQRFVFGITRRTPPELAPDAAAKPAR